MPLAALQHRRVLRVQGEAPWPRSIFGRVVHLVADHARDERQDGRVLGGDSMQPGKFRLQRPGIGAWPVYLVPSDRELAGRRAGRLEARPAALGFRPSCWPG
jgi:hypothetical protein